MPGIRISKRQAVAFLSGAVIGLAGAILLARSSGVETREHLTDWVDDNEFLARYYLNDALAAAAHEAFRLAAAFRTALAAVLSPGR